MKVFVTGATGFVGSAVVQELVANGHEVIGLTRGAAGAAKLKSQGAAARIGTLDQLDILRTAAAESEGVIHTAFIHGFGNMNLKTRLNLFAGALKGGVVQSFMRILGETETKAIDAMGKGLSGSGHPFVVTSGILMLPQGRISTEADSHVNNGPNRAFSESAALAFVPHNVRASVVRLPPSVHGKGDHGFIPQIIEAARKKGRSPYIGDGQNRWPTVHRVDAARLFRLALESGEAGAKYHAVAETVIAFREIAEIIGSKVGVPAVSCTQAEASKHFGFLSSFVGLDNPSSSEWTREKLGWIPKSNSLFEDLEKSDYFKAG